MGKLKNKKLSKQQKSKCKFSLRPLLEKQLLLMSSQLTPLKTSRLRFKTRKVSHQTSKDLSSLESSSKMAEPSPTTTFKKSQLFISSSDLEVECKFSSRLSLVRPLPSMLSQQTPSKMLRPRFKTRRVFLQISKDSSLLVSNLKTAELLVTTISKRNPLSISS